jgi:hypothetical protein
MSYLTPGYVVYSWHVSGRYTILLVGYCYAGRACALLSDMAVRPFFARLTAAGRWAAEEGHGDPSKRALRRVYYEHGMHI